MKSKSSKIFNRSVLFLSSLGLAGHAGAADGTWTNTAGGTLNWSDTTNWASSTIAAGADFTAFFDTLDITADTAVAMVADRTIGHLRFGDTDITSAFGWTLSGSTRTLTLSVTSGTPTIAVGALGGTKSATISTNISSAAGMVKLGAGTLTLSGTNTITSTSIQEGRINAAGSSALGSGMVSLDGTDAQLRLSADGVSLSNALTVSNTGNNKTLSGFTTSGSTTYSGSITINETTTGNFTVQTGDSHTLTISGNIGGNGGAGLKKTSAGALTLSGTNNYTGPNLINQGVINANSTTALGAATNSLTLANLNTGAGSTTTLNVGASITTGTLASGTISTPSSGTNGIKIDIGSGNTLAVNQTADATYAGEISGAGDFTLGSSSTHKLTLSASSTYTGATSVNAGTLIMGDAAADTFATSGVTVTSGGSLAGKGVISGTGNIQSGGKLAPGNSGVGTLTFNNTVTANNGSIFEWELGADADTGGGSNYDSLNVTSGGLTFGSSAIFRVIQTGTTDFTKPFWDANKTWTDIFQVTGGITTGWSNTAVSVFNTSGDSVDVSSQGSFTISGHTLQWTAIPEPTGALAGLLLGTGLLRRSRRGGRISP